MERKKNEYSTAAMADFRGHALNGTQVPMFGALLIHLAVIAAPPAAADAAASNCATTHCSVTVNEKVVQAAPENCAGVHCAPVTNGPPAGDARFGSDDMDASRDRAGLDAQSHRYGNGGVDRNFDSTHDTRFDSQGFDNSGTWPAH
jgi:hypothetical protein